jgi:BRCT domain type II-containing protein
VAGKCKDANKRSVVVVNLRRLQGFLLNHLSLHELETMPALTSVEFTGSAYQAAGAPPPLPPHTNQGPSASASSLKQPADSTSAAKMTSKPDPFPSVKMPSKPDPSTSAYSATNPSPICNAAKMPSKPNPSPCNTFAGGVSSNTHAIVQKIQSNYESNAVASHTGKKAKFTIPRPGVNGGVAGVLNGKRLVLTGVFPEVGGGTGLTLGKDRTKDMIESFGGKVTSAVSGKTDFVIVGRDPGRSKVSQADAKGVPMIDLISLERLLIGQSSLEATASEPPPRITNFSAGYVGQKRIAY